MWAFPFCQELTPDYSMESHQRDHENYVACLRSHRRRAKALLDFERHDDDELGFRKNDIITVCGGPSVHTSCCLLPTFPVELMLNKLDLSPAGTEDACFGKALSPGPFSSADHFPEG